MIAPFGFLLDAARTAGRAVGAFTVYDLGAATAVLRAAEARGVGVILIISPQAFAAPAGAALVAALRVLATASDVPVAIQLDHVSDLDAMARALDCGVTALMADGSKLPYEENVALVHAAVALARPHGAEVEAELGRIEGDEELALAAEAGALTDPAQAADYLDRSGADCLAVSIGNVHGTYSRPPELDWPRLEAVAAAVDRPLALHGASGLPDADLQAAIRRGVVKVNVNTELRQRWFATVAARAETLGQRSELLALQGELADALAEVVDAKLAGFELPPPR